MQFPLNSTHTFPAPIFQPFHKCDPSIFWRCRRGQKCDLGGWNLSPQVSWNPAWFSVSKTMPHFTSQLLGSHQKTQSKSSGCVMSAIKLLQLIKWIRCDFLLGCECVIFSGGFKARRRMQDGDRQPPQPNHPWETDDSDSVKSPVEPFWIWSLSLGPGYYKTLI